MKKWAKYLAAAGIPALVILLTLQGGEEISDGVGLSLVNMTVSQKDSVVRNEIGRAKVGAEIISMRSATAKIRKLGNNKFHAMISITPQHYLDEETQTYKDIDLTVYSIADSLKAHPERKFDKYVESGLYLATWFDKTPHEYTFHKDDYYVRYEALFDTTAITIETKPNNGGIKQDIILNDSTATNVLSWKIYSNAAYEMDNGVIIFKDSTGVFVFRMPALWAEDATDKIINLQTNISGDTLFCIVDIPLNAVYPIIVDPNTTVQASSDGDLVEFDRPDYSPVRDATTANSGITHKLRLGQNFDGTFDDYFVYRIFMAFEIPIMASCSAGSLYLNGVSNFSTTDFGIYIVTSTYNPTITTTDFNEFDGWTAGSAHTGTVLNEAWNSSSFSFDWNIIELNADGRADVLAAATDTLWIAIISKEDFDNSAPTDSERLEFDSSEDAGTEPYLSITFIAPPNAPTNFAISDSSTTSLTYTWTDNSGDEDGFFIKNTADTLTVGSFAANATTGEVTGLTPGTSYQFFVVAYNTIGESTPSGNVTHSTNFAYNYTYRDSLNLSDFKTHKADIDPTYATVRDTGTFTSVTTTAVDSIGQILDGNSKYHVLRTSSEIYGLPWMNEAVSGSLQINLVGNQSATDFALQWFQGEWTEAANEGTRYYLFDGNNAGAPHDGTSLTEAWDTSSFSAGLLYLKLTTAGLDLLETISQAGDSLRLVMISGNDSSNTAPTGNEYITLNDTNARIIFSWRRNSTKPTNFTLTPQSTTTVLATWTDNSIEESGFSIIRTSDDSIYVTVAADDVSELISSLQINEYQDWSVRANDIQAADSISTADSTWTHAAIPGKVTVSYPSTSEIKIILDINSNPAYTKFAIQDSISGKYVHLLGSGVDDTLRTAVDWNTYAEWGGANGDTVVAVPAKLYRFRSKSRSTNQ